MHNLSYDMHKEVLFGPAAVTTATSAYKSLQDCRRALVYAAMGATDNTFDLKVVQATDSSGTGSKDLTGAVITQLSGTDDNKQVQIEIDPDALDDGFTHIAVTLTIAGTTTAFVTLFKELNQKPVTQPAALTQTILVTG